MLVVKQLNRFCIVLLVIIMGSHSIGGFIENNSVVLSTFAGTVK